MPTTSGGEVRATWDLWGDLQQLFAFHFMHNAFLAGTLVALVAGAIGYFMVLRGESFAGHTLANVGFAGAAGAALLGLAPVVGLLAVGIAAALAIGLLGGRRGGAGGSGVAIAAVQTFCLGLGLLFERLSSHYAAGIYGILFGAVLGIADRDVRAVALTAAPALAALAVIARPLLFASLDPQVAAARGVPVRALTTVYLVVLAVAVAQAVQVVGVLLIFSLLVTPAAVAQRLTARPGLGLALAVLLALLFTWAGLAVAYFTPYPVGFFITSIAFATYAAVRLWPLLRRPLARRPAALATGGAA